MQKVAKILERYVEWVAIALGGAFLLWMVYVYVVQRPVTSMIGGEAVVPGDVDTRTEDVPVRQLRAAINSSAVPPELHEPQDFVSDLNRRLNPATEVLAMIIPWAGWPLPPLPSEAPIQQAPPVNPVIQLPTIAAADSLQVEQGRSNVGIPAPVAAGAVGNPPIPQAANAVPADRNWVSVSAVIHPAAIAKEYAKQNIPAQLTWTTILKVEFVRQEQLPNGKWGPETVVAPLPTVSILPYPAANAGQADQDAYIKWAENSIAQQALLQPPFYTVLQADTWVVPGMPAPVAPEIADVAPQPAAPAQPTPDQLRQQQLQQQQAQQQQQQSQEAARQRAMQQQQQQQQRQRGPGFGPGSGGGGYRVVDDPDRPMTLAQAVNPGPDLPGVMGAGDAGAGGAAAQNPILTNPGQSLPQGAFDPRAQNDILIWCHDDSVQPGKTYRYKIRYFIKNPVLHTQNVCNPQNLANQFDIQSADSIWTDPISVRSETNFFAVSVSPLRNNVPVEFEIFRWKNGAWQMQTTKVFPGDEVGSMDAARQIDFSTGLTLVDVRPDPLNMGNSIIVMTSDGDQITRHDLSVDRNNPEHKRLKDQVDAAKKLAAAAAGAAAGAGGTQ